MCQICAKHYMLSGLNIATVVLFSGLNISAGVDGGLSGVLCVRRHGSEGLHQRHQTICKTYHLNAFDIRDIVSHTAQRHDIFYHCGLININISHILRVVCNTAWLIIKHGPGFYSY